MTNPHTYLELRGNLYANMPWPIRFRATTHTDLVLRAQQKGVEYRVIHNASMFQSYYSHRDLVLRARQKGVEYRVMHNASMFQSCYSHRPGTQGSREGCRIQSYT